MPERIVLDIEQCAVRRPAELLAEIPRIAIAPVRPWMAPGLVPLRRFIDREPRLQECLVVVSELESVLTLDTVDLCIRQAWGNLKPARQGQPVSGLRTQPGAFPTDHLRRLSKSRRTEPDHYRARPMINGTRPRPGLQAGSPLTTHLADLRR